MQIPLAFGYNGFRQISNEVSVKSGSTECSDITVTIPTCLHADTFLKKHVKRIFIGWSYFIILSDNGEAQCTGFFKTKNNQLEGNESESVASLEPEGVQSIASMNNQLWLLKNKQIERILSDDSKHSEQTVIKTKTDQPFEIADLCGTESSVFCLTENGCVGELNTNETCTETQDIEFSRFNLDMPTKVVQLSCGKEHILMLTDEGTVLSLGSGSRGQLGHSTVEDVQTPQVIEALEGVKMASIAAGGWHSIAISEFGDLYIWGWNESGQLGLGTEDSNIERHQTDTHHMQLQTYPHLMNVGDANIAKAACGSRHTVILTEDAEVLSTGWNKYGQLGHGDLKTRYEFEKIKYFTSNRMTVTDIFCGYWNSIVLIIEND